MPGPLLRDGECSVARDERSTELVAQADHSRLDIARLCIERVGARRSAGELIALPLESRVVIFNTDDPVLGDAVFPAGTDGPAIVPLRLPTRTRGRDQIDDGQAVVHAGI